MKDEDALKTWALEAPIAETTSGVEMIAIRAAIVRVFAHLGNLKAERDALQRELDAALRALRKR